MNADRRGQYPSMGPGARPSGDAGRGPRREGAAAHAQLQSPAARAAQTLINASGSVIVDAGLPVGDLVGLAEAAAKWGAALTVRRAGARGTADLERIARAGRGRVTFDFSA